MHSCDRLLGSRRPWQRKDPVCERYRCSSSDVLFRGLAQTCLVPRWGVLLRQALIARVFSQNRTEYGGDYYQDQHCVDHLLVNQPDPFHILELESPDRRGQGGSDLRRGPFAEVLGEIGKVGAQSSPLRQMNLSYVAIAK